MPGWFYIAVAIGVVLLAAVAMGWAFLRNRYRLSQADPVPSRTALLLGQRGRVTEAIDSVVGRGRVTVGGDDWAARAEQPLPVGTEIVVDGADGIVLHVTGWQPPHAKEA